LPSVKGKVHVLKTREKSVNLPVDEVRDMFPGLVEAQTKQVRGNWKKRGVPWEVVGSIALRQLAASAQGLPDPRLFYPLPSEADMKELGEAWSLLVEVVKQRKGKGKVTWGIILAALEGFEPGARDVSGIPRPQVTRTGSSSGTE
jgi:hypothetical protein